MKARAIKGWQFAVLVGWLLANIYVAYSRSFSSDECPKYLYMMLPLKKALLMQMSELAPYAPGEIFIGYLAKLLFGFLPREIWSRVPALFFGGLSIWVAFQFELPFLVLPLVFSVALTSFATQYQPYTALIFGGALSFLLIWDLRLRTRTLSALSWFNLFFGHLYGICFGALAHAFRRDWLKCFLSVAFVGACLGLHAMVRRPFATLAGQSPAFFEILRQSLGSLTNPHKAALFYCPFLLLGLATLYVKQRNRFLRIGLFFGATIGAPIAASAIARYQFLPRQVMGALVPTLVVVAYGYENLRNRFKGRARTLITSGLLALNAVFALYPWVQYLRGVPPFVDQPIHRLHTLTRHFVDSGITNILWAEAGMSGTASLYFDELLGIEKELPIETYTRNGLHLRKLCWERGAGKTPLCMHVIIDIGFIFDGPRLMHETGFLSFLNGGDPVKFEALVYSAPELRLPTKIPLERTW